MAELVSRGVEVNGCDGCKDQCGGVVPKEEARWWYMPAKNKIKLQTKRTRRKEFKDRMRSRAVLPAELSSE